MNLAGNWLANEIWGNAGANILHGGSGVDALIGLGGNDVYYTDVAATLVVEAAGGGTDALYASVSYTMTGSAEIEILSANDAAATSAITLTGNGYNQTLAGNAGANILHGGGGTDLLIGFAGNDTYYTDVSATRVQEAAGGGVDGVYASVSYALGGGTEVELLSTNDYAATSAINLTGNSFNQTLVGNAGANALNGGGGTDVLIGMGGNDTYFIDVASTQIQEGLGGGADVLYTGVSYTLATGIEVETVSVNNHAGTAAIDLIGNNVGNYLIGNAGANLLDGKGGNDILLGNAGSDIFQFSTALGSANIDQVHGFEHNIDRISLDDAVFAGLALGGLSAAAFAVGSGAADASHRIIYKAATGALLFDADGNGAGAAVQFAWLNTGLAQTASDFAVI